MTNTGQFSWGAGLLSVVFLLGGAALPARAVAQNSAPGSPQTTMDKVYSTAQAGKGEEKFNQVCTACHLVSDLSGSRLREKWEGQSVGDVFDFISNSMPEGDPGSLTKDEYASILAYLLKQSGYPAGEAELPIDTAVLSKVKIVPLPK